MSRNENFMELVDDVEFGEIYEVVDSMELGESAYIVDKLPAEQVSAEDLSASFVDTVAYKAKSAIQILCLLYLIIVIISVFAYLSDV